MKVLKSGIYCLTAAAALACNTVKNRELSTAQQAKQLQMKELTKYLKGHEDQAEQKSIFLEHDSSAMAFTIEIWPSGPFNFSPYKGFEGTAQKIIYHGKAARHAATYLNQEKKESAKHTEMSSSNTTLEESSQSKHLNETLEVKRSTAWKWWLIISGGLLLAALCYRYLR